MKLEKKQIEERVEQRVAARSWSADGGARIGGDCTKRPTARTLSEATAVLTTCSSPTSTHLPYNPPSQSIITSDLLPSGPPFIRCQRALPCWRLSRNKSRRDMLQGFFFLTTSAAGLGNGRRA